MHTCMHVNLTMYMYMYMWVISQKCSPTKYTCITHIRYSRIIEKKTHAFFHPSATVIEFEVFFSTFVNGNNSCDDKQCTWTYMHNVYWNIASTPQIIAMYDCMFHLNTCKCTQIPLHSNYMYMHFLCCNQICDTGTHANIHVTQMYMYMYMF